MTFSRKKTVFSGVKVVFSDEKTVFSREKTVFRSTKARFSDVGRRKRRFPLAVSRIFSNFAHSFINKVIKGLE
jgi:hypothetical protein